MGLSVKEFWGLTFAEYWFLYDALFGKMKKPLTVKEFKKLESEWKLGNFRRTSRTANSRNFPAKN